MRLFGNLFNSGPKIEAAMPTSINEIATGHGSFGGDAGGGGYDKYRKWIGIPTLALCRAALHFPLIASKWTVEADDDAPEGAADFIREQVMPWRQTLVKEGLRAVDYGWQPVKIYWDTTGNTWTITKLCGEKPDEWKPNYDELGNLVSLKKGKEEIAAEKLVVYSYDVEGSGVVGRSRLENCEAVAKAWFDALRRQGEVATKAAAIVPVIHFPPGKQKMPGGQEKSATEAAQAIIEALSKAKGIAIPNLYASANANNPTEAAELAGKSQWMISFLESAGASGALSALTGTLEYYDKLLCRGYLIPERAVLESVQSGSRADSLTAAGLAVQGAVMLDQDIAEAVNDQLVDRLMEYNYGPSEVGKVRVKPAAIVDEYRMITQRMLDAILGSPGPAENLLDRLDVDAITDALGIPIKTRESDQPEQAGTAESAIATVINDLTNGRVTADVATQSLISLGMTPQEAQHRVQSVAIPTRQ